MFDGRASLKLSKFHSKWRAVQEIAAIIHALRVTRNETVALARCLGSCRLDGGLVRPRAGAQVPFLNERRRVLIRPSRSNLRVVHVSVTLSGPVIRRMLPPNESPLPDTRERSYRRQSSEEKAVAGMGNCGFGSNLHRPLSKSIHLSLRLMVWLARLLSSLLVYLQTK